MYNISGGANPEQIVNRLLASTLNDISEIILRLKLATTSFAVGVDAFEQVERDYIIGLIYTLNEKFSVLSAIGGNPHLDALLLHNIDARDWFNESIEKVHVRVRENEAVKADQETIIAQLTKLRPPKEMLPDEFGDDAALTESDKAKLAEENKVASISEVVSNDNEVA